MTKIDALSSVKLTKEFRSKKHPFKSFEEFAAAAIMTDLMDRREIKWIMQNIKEDDIHCFNNIKKTWAYIIAECFDDFIKNETHELINGDE